MICKQVLKLPVLCGDEEFGLGPGPRCKAKWADVNVHDIVQRLGLGFEVENLGEWFFPYGIPG